MSYLCLRVMRNVCLVWATGCRRLITGVWCFVCFSCVLTSTTFKSGICTSVSVLVGLVSQLKWVCQACGSANTTWQTWEQCPEQVAIGAEQQTFKLQLVSFQSWFITSCLCPTVSWDNGYSACHVSSAAHVFGVSQTKLLAEVEPAYPTTSTLMISSWG